MAIFTEQLVEEWLNRQGFFTIRGCNQGVHECDLLGMRIGKDKQIEATHCEVQVSARPIGYISPLTDAGVERLAVKGRNSAKYRDDYTLQESVVAWMEKKFFGNKKDEVRSKLWSGEWKMKFVHGNLKDDDARELDFMRERGIEVIPVAKIVDDLKNPEFGMGFSTAGLGTDIADLFKLCSQHEEAEAKPAAGSAN